LSSLVSYLVSVSLCDLVSCNVFTLGDSGEVWVLLVPFPMWFFVRYGSVEKDCSGTLTVLLRYMAVLVESWVVAVTVDAHWLMLFWL